MFTVFFYCNVLTDLTFDLLFVWISEMWYSYYYTMIHLNQLTGFCFFYRNSWPILVCLQMSLVFGNFPRMPNGTYFFQFLSFFYCACLLHFLWNSRNLTNTRNLSQNKYVFEGWLQHRVTLTVALLYRKKIKICCSTSCILYKGN